jgi:hypothetical protein
MSTKLVRFVAALAILVSIVGNAGVTRAAIGARPSVGAQNLEPPRAPQPLTIPAASSLGVQFVHVATAANINSNWTTIDHPLTNGKPNAIVLVTPNWNPGSVGGTYDKHPIGVWYTAGKWAIFNQDMAAMPVGAAFNVIIPTTGAGVLVHKATVANISSNWTTLDNPLTNGNPNAIVFVTPNWNPGSVGGTYDNHPIGVWYNSGRWAIFNQDRVAMPVDAAFNVLVLVPASGVFVHTATAGNIAGNYTKIDNALTNGNPNAIVFTTPNWNPGGVGGTYDKHAIGVWYDAGKWAIFNQDTAAMPVGAPFNVLVPNPDTSVFVHVATAANINSNWTTIDHPLTNGKPNAIVLVTPNWNPGSVGGTYDNHPIGVWYTAGKWAIFNQDIAAMPVGAAFNVIIPTTGAAVFVHKATVANISSNWTNIDHPLTNGNPNAIVFVTPNYNPGGVGGTYDNHNIGVWYDSGRWAIFNQDITAIPVNAAFNVYVFGNYKLYLPLAIR